MVKIFSNWSLIGQIDLCSSKATVTFQNFTDELVGSLTPPNQRKYDAMLSIQLGSQFLRRAQWTKEWQMMERMIKCGSFFFAINHKIMTGSSVITPFSECSRTRLFTNSVTHLSSIHKLGQRFYFINVLYGGVQDNECSHEKSDLRALEEWQLEAARVHASRI